jgi:hypothetical protein
MPAHHPEKYPIAFAAEKLKITTNNIYPVTTPSGIIIYFQTFIL